MRLICAFAPPTDAISLLQSSKLVLLQSVMFIRLSDFYWTGLHGVFVWASKSCTLITCPISMASGTNPAAAGYSVSQICSPLVCPVPPPKAKNRLLPVPSSQLLVKYKSKERQALMKAREVPTQDKHPYRRLGKLMGRCLSLLWKEAVTVLGSREIVAMSDILHPIRVVTDGRPPATHGIPVDRVSHKGDVP